MRNVFVYVFLGICACVCVCSLGAYVRRGWILFCKSLRICLWVVIFVYETFTCHFPATLRALVRVTTWINVSACYFTFSFNFYMPIIDDRNNNRRLTMGLKKVVAKRTVKDGLKWPLAKWTKTFVEFFVVVWPWRCAIKESVCYWTYLWVNMDQYVIKHIYIYII